VRGRQASACKTEAELLRCTCSILKSWVQGSCRRLRNKEGLPIDHEIHLLQFTQLLVCTSSLDHLSHIGRPNYVPVVDEEVRGFIGGPPV